MGVRLERTLLNWRWWVVLPIAVPVVALSALFAGNAELWALVSRTAHYTRKGVDEALGTFAVSAMKWARKDWR